jgi:hypothetical protein
MRSFNLLWQMGAWQPELQHSAGLITSGRVGDFKETALLPDSLTDIFLTMCRRMLHRWIKN